MPKPRSPGSCDGTPLLRLPLDREQRMLSGRVMQPGAAWGSRNDTPRSRSKSIPSRAARVAERLIASEVP